MKRKTKDPLDRIYRTLGKKIAQKSFGKEAVVTDLDESEYILDETGLVTWIPDDILDTNWGDGK